MPQAPAGSALVPCVLPTAVPLPAGGAARAGPTPLHTVSVDGFVIFSRCALLHSFQSLAPRCLACGVEVGSLQFIIP